MSIYTLVVARYISFRFETPAILLPYSLLSPMKTMTTRQTIH